MDVEDRAHDRAGGLAGGGSKRSLEYTNLQTGRRHQAGEKGGYHEGTETRLQYEQVTHALTIIEFRLHRHMALLDLSVVLPSEYLSFSL